YYSSDGVAGQVTLANATATTAASDAAIANRDADWPNSWYSIRATSALPTVSERVIIDGSTQPGTTVNSNPVGQGLNSVLRIEVGGQSAGQVETGLLRITAATTTLKGLVINRADGVALQLESSGNRIEGMYVGPDISGSQSFPPPGGGVTII